jgi:hypothetical protein
LILLLAQSWKLRHPRDNEMMQWELRTQRKPINRTVLEQTLKVEERACKHMAKKIVTLIEDQRWHLGRPLISTLCQVQVGLPPYEIFLLMLTLFHGSSEAETPSNQALSKSQVEGPY